MIHERRNGNLDFVKVKNLGSKKDAVKRIKIPAADWEKIFAKH